MEQTTAGRNTGCRKIRVVFNTTPIVCAGGPDRLKEEDVETVGRLTETSLRNTACIEFIILDSLFSKDNNSPVFESVLVVLVILGHILPCIVGGACGEVRSCILISSSHLMMGRPSTSVSNVDAPAEVELDARPAAEME